MDGGLVDSSEPSRKSGAPDWAIMLGLGTAEESAARPHLVKWSVRVLWTAVVTIIFVGCSAWLVGDNVSVARVVFWSFVAALTVSSWTFGCWIYLRKQSPRDSALS